MVGVGTGRQRYCRRRAVPGPAGPLHVATFAGDVAVATFGVGVAHGGGVHGQKRSFGICWRRP